jgi:beta-lactamase superfamily II metal-dependent hydrolase
MKSSGERLDNGTIELHALNVEQADATAVITEGGEIILTDADKKAVNEQLETVLADRTVERTENGTISLISATTHHHLDHVNGLSYLDNNEYEISHAIFPALDRVDILDDDADKSEKGLAEENLVGFIDDVEALGVEELTEASEEDEISVDTGTDLNVLSPPATDDSVNVTRASTGSEVQLPPERPNENSAVYKIESERSVLFMGDIQDKSDHYGESWLIQQHDNPESGVDLDTDVLFTAHHGSNNATSEEFLERTDPEIAVISSDFAEQHNHPHDTVLKNLHEHDVDVSWTAGHGTTRIDLDETLTTNPTEDLDTTSAADLAALKHYCGKNETDAADVTILAADDLPAETPEWVAENAPMVAETTQEMVDTAIANGESVHEVRQTLDDHPMATEHLRKTVEIDRDEAVTHPVDVRENRQAYRTAQRAQTAAQPSRGERVRVALPFVADPDIPEYDGPAPDEIEGPFTEDAIPPAVKDSETAATMRDDMWSDSPPDYLVAAEEQANTAVETAENAGELCWGLRDNPGAHKDVATAMESVYTHLPASLVSDGRENSRERSADMSYDNDQERGLGL